MIFPIATFVLLSIRFSGKLSFAAPVLNRCIILSLVPVPILLLLFLAAQRCDEHLTDFVEHLSGLVTAARL